MVQGAWESGTAGNWWSAEYKGGHTGDQAAEGDTEIVEDLWTTKAWDTWQVTWCH